MQKSWQNIQSFFLLFLLNAVSTLVMAWENNSIVFVGSTPGNDFVKSVFKIPVESNIDFIKWNLSLVYDEDSTKNFQLHIRFGESKPNTLEFIEEQSLLFNGSFNVTRSSTGAETFHLKSSQLSREIFLIRITDNILHLLDAQQNLAVGNGGWSYTLNRRDPVISPGIASLLATGSSFLTDKTLQTVFDGRTPCAEFANDYKLNVPKGCFKLKWRLILNRDPKTFQPSDFIIKRTDSRTKDITGAWEVFKDPESGQLFCQLKPFLPGKNVLLLVGDENVLFFSRINKQPYIGNADFSFTLNRKTLKQ